MPRCNLSVIIPTYNRISELEKCLRCVSRNRYLPREIIIFDDSEIVRSIKYPFINPKTKIIYLHKSNLKGLSHSRNAGLETATSAYLLYLDDDIYIQPDYIENLMNTWSIVDKKVIGIGGMVNGERSKKRIEKIYNSIFFCEHRYRTWDVTDTGFPVWDHGLKTAEDAGYINGGLMSLRTSSKFIPDLRFRQRSPGRSPADEIEFCLRATNLGYKFRINPQCRAEHVHSTAGKDGDYLIGRKEAKNHISIFKSLILPKRPNLAVARLKFNWAMLGWIGRQIAARRPFRAFGMILEVLRFYLFVFLAFLSFPVTDDQNDY